MKKRDLIFRIIFITIFLIVSTFAIYIPKSTQFASAINYANKMDRLELNEISNGIVLTKKYPVKDSVGIKGEETLFLVKNNSSYNSNYKLRIESIETEDDVKYLDLSNLKYIYKTNDGEYSEIKTVTEDGILDINEALSNSTNLYSFVFWIDYNSSNDVYGSTFSASISIENIA